MMIVVLEAEASRLSFKHFALAILAEWWATTLGIETDWLYRGKAYSVHCNS